MSLCVFLCLFVSLSNPTVCTTTWKALYTLERAANYNPFTEYLLPLGFTDSAMLYTFIGCADAFTSYFAHPSDANRAFWYLHSAISIVNKRLAMATVTAIASRSCISSGTLVLVSGLAMFEVGIRNIISVSYSSSC